MIFSGGNYGGCSFNGMVLYDPVWNVVPFLEYPEFDAFGIRDDTGVIWLYRRTDGVFSGCM